MVHKDKNDVLQQNYLLKYLKKNNIKKANMASIICRKHAELFLKNNKNIKLWFDNMYPEVADEDAHVSLLHHYGLQNELVLTYNIAAGAIIFARWPDMCNYKLLDKSIKKNAYTYTHICQEELDYLLNSKSLFGRKFSETCAGLENLNTETLVTLA